MTTNLTAEALMPGALDQAEVLEWVPDIGAHDRDEAVRGLLAILKAGLRGIESPDLMDGGVTAALIEKEAEKCDAYWEGRAAEEKRHVVTMRNLNALKARAEKAEDRADEAHNLIVALRADLAATEDRAEQAEKERDDALRRAKNAADQADEALGMAAYGECHDCIRDAAVIREPFTPEDVTDERVGRAAHCLAITEKPVTYSSDPTETAAHFYDLAREVLLAALTEPPQRPEGAEEIEVILREEWTFSDEDGGEEAFADLAGRLTQRGVRVVGGEDPR